MEEIKYNKINQRVKELRKALDMTQVSFSQVIALSSGYLAGIETEKRRVNNRLIKLICSSFKVNEAWLRSGDGDMFAEEDDEQYIKLVGLFKELNSQYRDYIFKEIYLLLKMQGEITEESSGIKVTNAG
ncbi:MAG: helix-turn-helix domain-containing protein [Treponema sp.]|nr:helix-turn-helix domain-containing protein [Treponema sp.]